MSEPVSGPLPGLPPGNGAHRCANCAWAEAAPDGLHCAAAAVPGELGPRLPDAAVACGLWESPVDCATCGACCREAFDAVRVEPEDTEVRAHAGRLVVRGTWGEELARVPLGGSGGDRPATRCAALLGDGASCAFRCSIYPHRPASCRDLAPGSANCLLARRRVGLSAR